MAQLSLNFGGHPAYPQVDAWGADAERFLLRHPDISLIRCRQLVELLVHAAGPGIPHRDLCDRIDELERRRIFPPKACRKLHDVRKAGNEAAHVSGLSVPGPGAWAQEARRALRITAEVWASFGAAAPGAFILPAAGDASDRARGEADAKLDKAAALVEDGRDLGAAERILGSIREGALRASGVSDRELDLLRLRTVSIRMAIQNHRGGVSGPPDQGLCERLVSWGDARALDQVVHLHNRHAVALLNELKIEEALARVSELEEWRAAPQEFLPGTFAGLEIRDWQRGALLGTRGQALAFLAHAEADPTRLKDALACFELATRCFTEADDLQRQETYGLHALVERVRLGGKLDAGRLALVEAAIDGAPRLPTGWSPESFRVGVALKAALVMGRRPPWIGRLVHELKWIDPDDPVPHPYEQIIGGVILAEKSPPKRLRRVLETTADEGGLIGWIAACYLAAADDAPAPSPPGLIRGWWDRYGIAGRPVRGVPGVLPFNYA